MQNSNEIMLPTHSPFVSFLVPYLLFCSICVFVCVSVCVGLGGGIGVWGEGDGEVGVEYC